MDSFIAGVIVGLLAAAVILIVPILGSYKAIDKARISALLELTGYRQRLYEARDYLVSDNPVIGHVCLWVLHHDRAIERLRSDIRDNRCSTMSSYLRKKDLIERRADQEANSGA